MMAKPCPWVTVLENAKKGESQAQIWGLDSASQFLNEFSKEIGGYRKGPWDSDGGY